MKFENILEGDTTGFDDIIGDALSYPILGAVFFAFALRKSKLFAGLAVALLVGKLLLYSLD